MAVLKEKKLHTHMKTSIVSTIIKKPVNEMKKEDFFTKLKNKCLDDEGIEATKQIIRIIEIKNGQELTKLYLKGDVILLVDVFEKFVKVSVGEQGVFLIFCVSLPGYTWQCGLKHSDNKSQTLQDQDITLLLENDIRGGISSVMDSRYNFFR